MRSLITKRQTNGHATVEFALGVPLLFLFTAAFLDFSLIGFKQIRLEYLCGTLGRELSMSDHVTPNEMQLAVQARLLEEAHVSIEPHVELRPLPTLPPASPYRRPKTVEIIRVVLRERFESPFPLLHRLFQNNPLVLRAEVREARVIEAVP